MCEDQSTHLFVAAHLQINIHLSLFPKMILLLKTRFSQVICCDFHYIFMFWKVVRMPAYFIFVLYYLWVKLIMVMEAISALF